MCYRKDMLQAAGLPFNPSTPKQSARRLSR
jgi:hypothetical protein